MWRDYVRDDGHARHVGEFRKLAEDEDPAVASWAMPCCSRWTPTRGRRRRPKAEAERAIESAWKTPRDAASLLRAIGRTDAVKYAFQVRNHLKDEHPEVKEAAAFAAARLDLDRETAGRTGARRSRRSRSSRSSPRRRRRRATRSWASGCSSGRGASPATPSPPARRPRGRRCWASPTDTSRAELTESILKPSAKIAQGFEPQKIATVDGRTYEGFVVRESGDEVELRDAQGTVDRRRPRKTSTLAPAASSRSCPPAWPTP